MDAANAREHAEAWVAAFNRRDLDAVMAFYADDVELRSPLVTRAFGLADGVLKGKDAVRKFFALGTGNPALHFDLVEVLVGARAITVLYRNQTGALVADCEEFDTDGRICRMTACYGSGAA
jgi:ketosteroid isomerase-like protein